ncbi:hypothetical protein BpHYR1_024775 [Brachionus plicatilis]|uniref:Uncharacterized protein n=1 Tax=Brachionus plicatilis TaxID=10195 RepID=A0A3M7S9A6_BRAPC|nr:hypothetical protein BpHYR1_024775 [Brachionus plicatilis]
MSFRFSLLISVIIPSNVFPKRPQSVLVKLNRGSASVRSMGLDGSFKTHRSSSESIISSRTRPLASKDLHPTTGVLAFRSPKMIRSSPNSHVRKNI